MTKALARRGVGGASALTSFVGRRRELSAAKLRMTESRLVTLTGPGGVGKTRLAFELADRSRKAFRDGVCEIELASLEEEASVASTMLAALSVPDQSTRRAAEKLVDYLRERQILIAWTTANISLVRRRSWLQNCCRKPRVCGSSRRAGNRWESPESVSA
jgi:hypothetical protein